MAAIKLTKEPDYSIKHDSFLYQQETLDAIKDLEYSAIFLEQGLGKTKVAIDLLLYWFESKIVDTVLLIVKKGLIDNWLREFRFHAHVKPRLLTQKKKDNFYVFNSPVRVIITHFEVVKAEEKRLKLFLKTRRVATIIDESAKIKNPDSSLTKSFMNLSDLFFKRIIMTGTPIANRPFDIWAQIKFLDHGKSLGTDFKEFKKKFNLSNKLYKSPKGQEEFATALNGLHSKISSFSIRITKDSGVIMLPKKRYKTIITNWETYQLELYRSIQNEERALVIKDGIPKEDRSDECLKRLLRLLQVASNPKLIDDNYSQQPGKFEHLLDLISDISSQNEKCIIWTSFTENADWLYDELNEYGCVKVHGNLDMEYRIRSINKFLEDDQCKIFVATPGAAKEGLTLTVANHVIFYDRSFSLDDYLQAQDRIHRISQNKECFIYNLIMPDSIDEWVDKLLESKELSAKLGQGDISLEYFNSKISYEFGEIIKNILNIQDGHDAYQQ